MYFFIHFACQVLCHFFSQSSRLYFYISKSKTKLNRAIFVQSLKILKQSKRVLSGVKGYESGNLYIGDNKFGSISNRASVVSQSDYYLLPLSLVQLSQKEREGVIKNTPKSLKVEVEQGKERVLVAEGFEESKELIYTLAGKVQEWTERRLYVLSHAYGLVNLLLLALKVSSVLEYKIAKALNDKNEELKNIFEGNPTRGTKKPSAKRIFNAFQGITIALVFSKYDLLLALMTHQNPTQIKILEHLNISPNVYANLVTNIKIFFSQNIITET